MKTRFDKITESPEKLAEFIDQIDYKLSCYYCSYSNDCTELNPQDCKKGIVEWLNQPLPMNEQFTDADIHLAKRLKSKGFEYIVRDDFLGYLYAFSCKPIRRGYGWENPNAKVTSVIYSCFANIKWEDEPILLDDIINSKEKANAEN